jgi:hypothetical protein
MPRKGSVSVTFLSEFLHLLQLTRQVPAAKGYMLLLKKSPSPARSA